MLINYPDTHRLGSHRGDKLHRPSSLLEIMWWELSKVRHPTVISGNEQGDEYRKVLTFIAQVHRPTKKRCKR